GRGRRRVRDPGPARRECEERLRLSRQHGRDHLLHPLPADVRRFAQGARTGPTAGSEAGTGRGAHGDRDVFARHGHARHLDRAGRLPARRRGLGLGADSRGHRAGDGARRGVVPSSAPEAFGLSPYSREVPVARSLLRASLLAPAVAVLVRLASAATLPPPPPTWSEVVRDTLHGTLLEDPYRWLEDQKSPATRAWIDAENAYTDQVMKTV